MADADRERWDDRYAGAPAEVVPGPPDRLEALVDRLPDGGRVLDIACGTGSQSLWAALRGFEVDAIDISPNAIGRLVSAAEDLGVAGRVSARTADLDTGLPDDLGGHYDLVIVQRFRAPHLYPELVAALAPDGLALVSVLSEVGHDGDPGPFRAAAGELDDAFGALDVEIIGSTEADGLATVVVRSSGAGTASLHPLVAEAVVGLRVDTEVFACDPDAADTAVFCETYGFAMEDSANTIVVIGKATEPVYAACVVLASTKLAVNSVVRRRLGTKKASFAPGDVTKQLTDMEIGGVTAMGLPPEIPVWVDAAVMTRDRIILGGGNRSTKLVLSPHELLKVPGVEIVDDLATPLE